MNIKRIILATLLICLLTFQFSSVASASDKKDYTKDLVNAMSENQMIPGAGYPDKKSQSTAVGFIEEAFNVWAERSFGTIDAISINSVTVGNWATVIPYEDMNKYYASEINEFYKKMLVSTGNESCFQYISYVGFVNYSRPDELGTSVEENEYFIVAVIPNEDGTSAFKAWYGNNSSQACILTIACLGYTGTTSNLFNN